MTRRAERVNELLREEISFIVQRQLKDPRLGGLISEETAWSAITPERLLQGPLADAMTHAGQLAVLRRLAGEPVPPENFVFADVSAANLGPDQPMPASPDEEWPERP